MRSQPYSAWYHSLWFKISLVVIIGLTIAQLMTGTIWSNMRRQVNIEVPSRVIAQRIADWYLQMNHHPHQANRLHLVGLTATEISAQQIPPPYQLKSGWDFNPLFASIFQERLGVVPEFYITALRKQDTKHELFWLKPGNAQDPEQTRDIYFEVVIRLPDLSIWLLQTQEIQGLSGFNLLEQWLDYLLNVYLLRFALVVLALVVALHFILKPLYQLEHSVRNMSVQPLLRQIPQKGAREFRRLGKAFQDLLNQQYEGMQEKAWFYSAISHDLRTPLARLQLRAGQIADEQLRTKIQTDLQDLNSLISSTLEYVGLQQHNETPQKLDIAALVQSVVLNRQELGEAIHLHKLYPATLELQPERIKRCLENLISNGLRYGQRVDISSHLDNGKYIIRVHDQGPGISKANWKLALKPYYRLEGSRNKETGGYGLGLSICQEIAQANHGDIRPYYDLDGFAVDICLPYTDSQS